MNIAFVINGQPEHGITRATNFLARALEQVEGVRVFTFETVDDVPDAKAFAAFQKTLPEDAILVFHASHRTNPIWGPYDRRLENISGILRMAERPVALYLHDVYGVGMLQNIVEKLKKKFLQKKPVSTLKAEVSPGHKSSGPKMPVWFKFLSYEQRFMYAVDPYVTRYIVSNEIEKGRLSRFVPAKWISVLPHFIEKRELPCDTDTAKGRIGLTGRKIVTMIGFVLQRKGYEDAIELLPHLPSDTHLVFAGRADELYQSELRKLAEQKSIANRLTITGYLSEEDLNLYMAASDVGLCPFREVSASGSLSTWLSVGKPVAAYNLPLLKEYRKKFPSQVNLAHKGNLKDLAGVVNRLLASPPAVSGSNIDEYSIENSALKLAQILRMVEKR